MKGLKVLTLDHTRVTDAGMKDLAGLTELEELSLSDTVVTDAGLKELRSKMLTKVSVRGCKKVTRSGIAALKALNPKVVIDGP